MTFKRVWSPQYIEQIKAISDEKLRTSVRTTTTLLAGNPWMAPSEALSGSLRTIGVKGRATITYEVCPRSVLKFHDVMVSPQG